MSQAKHLYIRFLIDLFVKKIMNITKVTEQYINERPSIRDCVKKKLINYSRLSRQVIRESRLKSSDFDAVLIAARRYFWKLSKLAAAEDKIRSLLGRSRIEIKNKMAAV